MTRHPDSTIIDRLGGPTALARMLGLSGPGAAQRVANWRRRGIPLRVKVEHARVFVGLLSV